MSEQVEQSRPDIAALWPVRTADPGAEHALKSLAKTLARNATAEIDDRRLRAAVRTRCYNQTLTLLRQVDERWSDQRRRLLRALIAAGATAVAASVVLLITLMI